MNMWHNYTYIIYKCKVFLASRMSKASKGQNRSEWLRLSQTGKLERTLNLKDQFAKILTITGRFKQLWIQQLFSNIKQTNKFANILPRHTDGVVFSFWAMDHTIFKKEGCVHQSYINWRIATAAHIPRWGNVRVTTAPCAKTNGSS